MASNHVGDILRYRDRNGVFAIDAYNKEVEKLQKLRETIAQQVAVNKQKMWKFIQNDNREEKMADKQLFTVYQGTNGFFAKLANGSTVIGATMQELCVAAQAETVSARIGESEAKAGEVVQEREKLWSQFLK